MKKHEMLSSLGAGIGMIILILDSKTALEGARSGLELALYTVIPSLFPFFFLSILLTSAAGSADFSLLHPLTRLCRIPPRCGMFLIPAFLGGYPTGAQSVHTAWKQGTVLKEDAEKLLSFCSNAGPSFLFGILWGVFEERWMVWSLWMIHIAGALFSAQLFSGAYRQTHTIIQSTPLSASEVLKKAVTVTASVGGWIILFRIAIAFLSRWLLWLLPLPFQVLTAGLLELTNGCCMLADIPDVRLRFVLCACMLSAGGLCVTLQTVSVTDGLSRRYYYAGKLCQTLFSLCISTALIYRNCLFILPLALTLLPTLQKKKKAVAFRKPLMYNNSIG